MVDAPPWTGAQDEEVPASGKLLAQQRGRHSRQTVTAQEGRAELSTASHVPLQLGCLAANSGFKTPSLGWVSSKARTMSEYRLCPKESQGQEGAQEKHADTDELGI